jgi:hypothetical protein
MICQKSIKDLLYIKKKAAVLCEPQPTNVIARLDRAIYKKKAAAHFCIAALFEFLLKI